MKDVTSSRRRFLAACSAAGLSTTLLPGVLWARLQESGAAKVTLEMLNNALALSGLDFSEDEKKQILTNLNPARYDELRKIPIHETVAPPLYYSPLVPGTRLDRTPRPFRASKAPAVKRPAHLEDAAFWPLTHLAELLRTRQVTSTDLTKMYLTRLHRYNPLLNFVVTFTDELALAQAAQADHEIAAGRHRGPLHGIPWGCKDIIAVPGFKTTWGSGAYQDQQLDYEATVVKLLREAGAVLVAKLTTGELAAGDNWFGGRTNTPWNPKQGSSGSSAGPGSATAAGCVAFAIGTETSGSILSPSTVNGVTGLRPTFGRVSRFGAMTLSWSQDRLGPMCRYAEDCATVFHAIARTDENDLSVIDLPFNWDARLDVRTLRVGYLAAGFAENRDPEWKANEDAVVAELRAIGVTLEPFELPKMPNNVLAGILGAESGAAFDQALRGGRLEKMTNKQRSNGFRSSRLTPAVEYLQAQRVRAIVMKEFAAAVSKYDVYLAPSTFGSPRAAGRGGEGPTGPAPAGPPPQQPPSPTRDHFSIANVCGYPAVSVPNGFTTAGTPTSILFLGRLYNEAAILALAKAYQDRTGWHRRTPPLAQT